MSVFVVLLVESVFCVLDLPQVSMFSLFFALRERGMCLSTIPSVSNASSHRHSANRVLLFLCYKLKARIGLASWKLPIGLLLRHRSRLCQHL